MKKKFKLLSIISSCLGILAICGFSVVSILDHRKNQEMQIVSAVNNDERIDLEERVDLENEQDNNRAVGDTLIYSVSKPISVFYRNSPQCRLFSDVNSLTLGYYSYDYNGTTRYKITLTGKVMIQLVGSSLTDGITYYLCGSSTFWTWIDLNVVADNVGFIDLDRSVFDASYVSTMFEHFYPDSRGFYVTFKFVFYYNDYYSYGEFTTNGYVFRGDEQNITSAQIETAVGYMGGVHQASLNLGSKYSSHEDYLREYISNLNYVDLYSSTYRTINGEQPDLDSIYYTFYKGFEYEPITNEVSINLGATSCDVNPNLNTIQLSLNITQLRYNSVTYYVDSRFNEFPIVTNFAYNDLDRFYIKFSDKLTYVSGVIYSFGYQVYKLSYTGPQFIYNGEVTIHLTSQLPSSSDGTYTFMGNVRTRYCYTLKTVIDSYKKGYDSGYPDGWRYANVQVAEDYNTGYKNGYESALNKVAEQNDWWYQSGYSEGYHRGYDDGLLYSESSGQLETSYAEGYSDGYEDGFNSDTTITSIFGGILTVAMVPVNFFLKIFNFEILGINLSSFIRALFTVVLTVIVLKTVMGKGGGGSDN